MKTLNIVGAGNVAHYFGIKLTEAGYDVRCIYNRTIQKANALAEKCGSMATDDLIALPNSDLTLIAITDDHIAKVASEIVAIHGSNIPMVHTSGAKGLKVFPDEILEKGCIWPLQSITANQLPNMDQVPLCIDASSPKFAKEIEKVCNQVSTKVLHMDSAKKKYAHVAAVLANNFTNHLLTLSEEYCIKHEIDFEILKPLIFASVQKIADESPSAIQTGPARRMDMKTINDHLDLIEDKSLKKMYRTITKSIINTYHENH